MNPLARQRGRRLGVHRRRTGAGAHSIQLRQRSARRHDRRRADADVQVPLRDGRQRDAAGVHPARGRHPQHAPCVQHQLDVGDRAIPISACRKDATSRPPTAPTASSCATATARRVRCSSARPFFTRFDIGVTKRFPIAGRVNFELRARRAQRVRQRQLHAGRQPGHRCHHLRGDGGVHRRQQHVRPWGPTGTAGVPSQLVTYPDESCSAGLQSREARSFSPAKGHLMPRRLTCVAAFVVACAAVATGQTAVYFPERFDWQRRTPGAGGLDAAALDAAIKFAVANENPAPKDLALAHAQGLARASRSTRRSVRIKPRAARQRPHHPQRLRRRRMGRHRARRHDVQRDQDVPVHGRRPRVAEGVDPRRRRQGARLHAAGRRSVRRPAQSADHVGSSAAPDQRLARARSGASPTGRIGRKASRTSGRTARCMSPARATSTTTCA